MSIDVGIGGICPPRLCNKQRSAVFIFRKYSLSLKEKCPRSVVPSKFEMLPRPCRKALGQPPLEKQLFLQENPSKLVKILCAENISYGCFFSWPSSLPLLYQWSCDLRIYFAKLSHWAVVTKAFIVGSRNPQQPSQWRYEKASWIFQNGQPDKIWQSANSYGKETSTNGSKKAPRRHMACEWTGSAAQFSGRYPF